MEHSGPRRRRTDVPAGFEPNSPFEVYVKVTLDGIEKKFDKLPCGAQDERVRTVEQKVSKMEGKASVFGALGGVITYLITKLFSGK